eukprot:gene8810-9714_t
MASSSTCSRIEDVSRDGYELLMKLTRVSRPSVNNHSIQEVYLSNLLPQCSLFIETAFSSDLTSDLTQPNNHVYYAEYILRAAVSHINNLMNVLWQVKNKTTRLHMIVTMYLFLKALKARLDLILSSCTHLAAMKSVQSYLSFCSATSLPAFLLRLDALVIATVQTAVRTSLEGHFDLYKDEFLLVMHERCQCLGVSEMAVPSRDDKALYTLIKTSGIDPVLQAVDSVEGRRRLKDDCHVLSVAINASVTALMETLLARRIRFDEAGVYKFYRLLLQLIGLVSQLKKTLQLPEDQHLVEEGVVWQVAEEALQTLHEEVFALQTVAASHIHRKNSHDTPLSQAVSNGILATPVLSSQQRTQWRQLVFDYRSTWLVVRMWDGLRRWRARHRGTVFVALTVDLHDL